MTNPNQTAGNWNFLVLAGVRMEVMVFELLDDLHPDLNPLMWLVGNWHGNGRFADDKPFEQDIVFHHDGREFLHYASQSWLTNDSGERTGPGEIETGFLFIRPSGGIELLISTHEGFGQALDGEMNGPRLTLATKWQARPETSAEYTEQRMYGLVESDLMYAIDRKFEQSAMQSYSWGQLKRV